MEKMTGIKNWDFATKRQNKKYPDLGDSFRKTIRKQYKGERFRLTTEDRFDAVVKKIAVRRRKRVIRQENPHPN